MPEQAASEKSAWSRSVAAYGPLLVLTFVGFFIVPRLAPILGVARDDQQARKGSRTHSSAGADQTRRSVPPPNERSALDEPSAERPELSPLARSVSKQDMEEIAGSIAPDAIQDKLDSLTNDNSKAAVELRSLLVRTWAQADPGAAAAWAVSHSDSAGGPRVVRQAVVVWADTNLPAAIEWVDKLPAGDARQTASIAVGYEAARSDPVQALNLAIPLPQSHARDELLVYGMRQYASKEPEAASQWAVQVEDPGLRNRLLEAVSTAASVSDPSSAASLVSASMSPGADQNRAAVTVVQRWAQLSPQSAAAWVNIFPVGGVRTDAIEHLIGIWSRQDPQAATNWLNSLPEGQSLASNSR